MKKLLLGCFITLLFTNFTHAQEDAIKDSLEVFFALDRATLKDESKTAIDSAFVKYKERLIKMVVAGHTCDLGTNNYNMSLSQKRAESAFEYIKTLGDYAEKCELTYYGEKELKYDERDANRRVHVLFYLEDDDKDTTITKNCAEVFVEKKTYQPNKNKKISFSLMTYSTASDMSAKKLSIMDNQGRKLYFNSVVYFGAMFDGQTLEPNKNVKIKLPLVNDHKDGYTLYTGEENSDGEIVWRNTGKPCALSAGADCNTYDFDWMLNGYCACAVQRKCDDDCNPDPFSGEELPSMTDADVRYSDAKTVAKFAKGTFSNMSGVTVMDDDNMDEDLDVCEHFKYSVTTDMWFPSRHNVVNAKKNILVKSDELAERTNTTRLYVKKSDADGMKEPVILVGDKKDKKDYQVWGNETISPTTCLGEVNCDYLVFDVPATGYYKLCEWSDKDKPKLEEKAMLKTRLLKNSSVYIGNTTNNYVYMAGNANVKGKVRPKEYSLTEFDNASDIVVYIKNSTKKKPMYQEAKLSDLIYKEKRNLYIVRLRDFTKVDSFDEVELSKCK